MAKVISFINSKGGVAKTTSAVNVATSLRNMKKKVLLIDMDFQADATYMLGMEQGDVAECHVGHALMKPDCFAQTVYELEFVKKEGNKKFKRSISLCPSHSTLGDVTNHMTSKVGREFKLQKAIKTIREDYDYIIIDCPPDGGLCCVNALVASDYYILLIDGALAMKNIAATNEMIEDVHEIAPNLNLLGVLFTKCDNTAVSKQVIEAVSEGYENNVFKTNIPYRVDIRESSSMPLCAHKSSGAGNKAYVALAKEINERIKKLDKKVLV